MLSLLYRCLRLKEADEEHGVVTFVERLLTEQRIRCFVPELQLDLVCLLECVYRRVDLPVVILQQLPRLEELQLRLHLEHGSNKLVSLHLKLLLLPLSFQPLLLFHVELASKLSISLLSKLALTLVLFQQEFVLDASFALESLLGAIYTFLALRCNLIFVMLHKQILTLYHLLDFGYRGWLTLDLSA